MGQLSGIETVLLDLDGTLYVGSQVVPGAREAVRRLAAGAPSLSDAQRAELTAVMTAFLPDAPLSWMIGLGADAVAAELV